MDKQTLSNYGWVVIVTLVLAIMLALATPFGKYIGKGVVSVANGFVGTSNQSLDENNISKLENRWTNKFNPLNPKGKIPEGATYTCADGTVLNENDKFLSVVSDGDIYTYEDYKYTYSTASKGWEVEINTDITDVNQTNYGAILESINSSPITSVAATFAYCTALTTSPAIPSSVTNMSYTFRNCTALTTAPTIPRGVTNMVSTFYACTALIDVSKVVIPSGVTNIKCTFYKCTSLAGAITINANPTTWTKALYNTKISTVVGDTTMSDDIILTKTSTVENPTA